MAQISVKTRAGEILKVPAKSGLSIMEILRDSGLGEIAALCGGSCSCATCHVYVDATAQKSLAPMEEVEGDLLSGSDHRTEQSRLSCQLIFADDMDGMQVTVAPED